MTKEADVSQDIYSSKVEVYWLLRWWNKRFSRVIAPVNRLQLLLY